MIDRVRQFKGVDASVPAEQLPEGILPSAYNVAFRDEPGAGLGVERRPGIADYGSSIATQPAALTQWTYWPTTPGAAAARYVIAVDTSANAWNVRTPASEEISLSGLALGSAGAGVRFEPVRNALYVVSCTGDGQPIRVYRTDGDSTLYAQAVGMPAPESAPTFISEEDCPPEEGTGLAGGTIDVAVTWYNSLSGCETSRSPLLTYELTSTGSKVTIGTSHLTPPTGATHMRVYIRRQEIQTKLWRDASMEVAIGDPEQLQFSLAYDDDTLNAMVTPCPDEDENDEPPAGLIDLCWHQGRMFATDGASLFYSQLDNPEQWDPEYAERPGWGDGQKILRLWSLDQSTLIVFKERSIWTLSGDAPQTWIVNRLSATQGLIAPLSLCALDRYLFGWGEDGPWRWDVGEGSVPQSIAAPVALPAWRAGTLTLRSSSVYAAADVVEHRVLWRIAEAGGSAWTVLPYHLLGFWESLGWDPQDLAALAPGVLPTGVSGVFAARSDGKIGYFTSSATGDFGSGAMALTTTAATTTPSTFTLDSAVSVTGLQLTVIHPTTLVVSRHSYTTVNGTSLVVTPGVICPAGTRVFADRPVAELTTGALLGGNVNARKRWLFGEARAESGVSGHFGLLNDLGTSAGRSWALAQWARLCRVALSGWRAQLKAVWWNATGRLWELMLRSQPTHDRR